MNRSRSSSRALGRSHCTHLRERREGGVGGGGVGWGGKKEDTFHMLPVYTVMDIFLRGEERAHRTGTPGSPLR